MPPRYDAYRFPSFLVRTALMDGSSSVTVAGRLSIKASLERGTGSLDCGPRKPSKRRSRSVESSPAKVEKPTKLRRNYFVHNRCVIRELDV
ncbi:hypothetical protein Zmor_010368 [Zophobas morio]|uniref:Uncharacterized protein n=1 Tax=Zophobas morio TaxID=2755281 RepID=A0AA38MJK6_9CUCU|nr:hypothetical protein Zmor_010368 [Zophobas morio]